MTIRWNGALAFAAMVVVSVTPVRAQEPPAALPSLEALPAPALSEAAVQSGEYQVGVDDVLDVTVIKPESIAGSVTVAVAPDGAITVPYIGNVQAKGLTLPKIQDEVQRRLADGYVEFPIVSVSLRQTRSKKFVIYGQVTRPGAYPVEEQMTLVHAIAVAGGFISPGAMGRVKLLRPTPEGVEPEAEEFEITAILSGAHQHVIVQPGDTIVVTVDKFFISGQVTKPGAYPVEEQMTLLQAITLAGGFVESRATGHVKLLRPNPDGAALQVAESDVEALLSGAQPSVTVLPGDTIVVSADTFFVYGEVNRPGMYPLEQGTTALTAISVAGGFSKFGSAGRVKVLRTDTGGDRSQTIRVKLKGALAGDAGADVPLKPGDVVVVSEGMF